MRRAARFGLTALAFVVLVMLLWRVLDLASELGDARIEQHHQKQQTADVIGLLESTAAALGRAKTVALAQKRFGGRCLARIVGDSLVIEGVVTFTFKGDSLAATTLGGSSRESSEVPAPRPCFEMPAAERADFVRRVGRVNLGDSRNAVVALLGLPDYEQWMASRDNPPTVELWSLRYYLRRWQAHIVNEREDHLVTFIFDRSRARLELVRSERVREVEDRGQLPRRAGPP